MRHFLTYSLLAVLLPLALTSCLKQANETILVHDPQQVPFITDERWPRELLELFGEENVNFGDTPPSLDCAFVSRHRYAATNLPEGESPAIGSISPVLHYHRFTNQYIQICEYQGMNSSDNVRHIVDTAYVTGHDSLFTAYWLETWTTSGSPTLAVVLSGSLTDKGVAHYRYGYQILGYADDDIPFNIYPSGSVFVFQSPDSLSHYAPW